MDKKYFSLKYCNMKYMNLNWLDLDIDFILGNITKPRRNFLDRLENNSLNNSEAQAYFRELITISNSDKRIQNIRDFSEEMKKKYPNSNECFNRNMLGKLGEEAVKSYLGDLITDVDYKIYKKNGDGKTDFRLRQFRDIFIQVKTRQGDINDIQWEINQEEINKNRALVCVYAKEKLYDIQNEYNLIIAGFIPKELLNKHSFKVDELLCGSGLSKYLELVINTQIENNASYLEGIKKLIIQNPNVFIRNPCIDITNLKTDDVDINKIKVTEYDFNNLDWTFSLEGSTSFRKINFEGMLNIKFERKINQITYKLNYTPSN
jgi:hypothetical protein